MKKLLSICIVLLLAVNISFAQHPEEKKDKIETIKIGLITDRLDLNAEQAQKFWPVYNEYNDKKQQLRGKCKKFYCNKKEEETPKSDKEIIECIKGVQNIEQQKLDLQKEYVDKFLLVLSPKQVLTLYKVEKEFKRMLLKKLKEHHGNMPNKGCKEHK